MGVATALIGGAMLGLGISSLGNRNRAPSYSPSQINYQSPAATLPTLPEAPVEPTDDGAKKSDAILAAEEEERKRRAAEAAANRTNHTSGLGIIASANVDRKTLLG
ncbi:MAG: hypothetical protein LIQ30_06930 [Planctomycetes bacterium]|nr:hypothetical protein [Planctomycetota bacterium]MCD7896954.1 hypothetical protein [Planctomycetaceae bacterium]